MAGRPEYVGGFAVTPHDTNVQFADALYIGGAGNVAVQGHDGNTVTFTAVPVGTTLEIGVNRVLATGTTATNIVGMRRIA